MAEADASVLSILSTVSGLKSGESLFLGPEVAHQEKGARSSVFVLDTGGPINSAFVGGYGDWRVRTVQVFVRSDQYGYEGGQALARACFDAIHWADLSASGFLSCVVRDAGPVYLPPRDSKRQHRWSINVELRQIVEG